MKTRKPLKINQLDIKERKKTFGQLEEVGMRWEKKTPSTIAII